MLVIWASCIFQTWPWHYFSSRIVFQSTPIAPSRGSIYGPSLGPGQAFGTNAEAPMLHDFWGWVVEGGTVCGLSLGRLTFGTCRHIVWKTKIPGNLCRCSSRQARPTPRPTRERRSEDPSPRLMLIGAETSCSCQAPLGPQIQEQHESCYLAPLTWGRFVRQQ